MSLTFLFFLDPEESVTQSPRAVKFSENTSQPKRSSNSVFRSKSFAAPGKDRPKQTGREDAPNPKQDRLSRSFSFGAKKKHQPPRPRPPTFFVSEQEPDDVANPETVSKEPSTDDVIMDEGISSSQEGNTEIQYNSFILKLKKNMLVETHIKKLGFRQSFMQQLVTD